jgi:hypothetical protein
MKLLPMYPLYVNAEGNTSPLMRDVIGEKARVRLRFVHGKLKRGETPFAGIDIIPYNKALKLNSIFPKSRLRCSRSKNPPQIKVLVSLIEEAINTFWDSNKFNLIFHSSGYDSRILSYFITRIVAHRGGEFLFVCMEPEGNAFKSIMQYFNISEANYQIYDRLSNPYNLMFDFATTWKYINGMSLFPMSVFHACVEYLRRIGAIPEDLSMVNVWSGLHMNEVVAGRGTLDQLLKRRYYSKLSAMWGSFLPANAIHPFVSSKILEYITLHAYVLPEVRIKMLQYLDPTLAKFFKAPRASGQSIKHIYNTMIDDYKNSYYYHNIDDTGLPYGKVVSSYSHLGFWRKWAFASLIEYLVERGVDIS